MKQQMIVVLAGTLLISVNPRVHSQGFVNLDFENAVIVHDPEGPYAESVYASNAIPGWTAYIGGVAQQNIIYNSVPLSSAWVTLQGSGGFATIGGQYCMQLFGQYRPGGLSGMSAAIGQSGMIPLGSQTLLFEANITVGGPYVNSLSVTFNGQNLAFQALGSTTSATLYGADITPFSGQSGELLFTVPLNGISALDNIQFSSSAIPEPSALSLFGLGLLGLCWHWRRRG